MRLADVTLAFPTLLLVAIAAPVRPSLLLVGDALREAFDPKMANNQ